MTNDNYTNNKNARGPFIEEDTIIQSGMGVELQSANNDFDWLMENAPTVTKGDELATMKKQQTEQQVRVGIIL